jgi:hypothetical protein
MGKRIWVLILIWKWRDIFLTSRFSDSRKNKTGASHGIRSLCATNATIFEMKPLPNPMQHELALSPIGQVNGHICAPEGPGLGIEVIEATMQEYNLKK